MFYGDASDENMSSRQHAGKHTTSWQHAGWTVNFPALNTQVAVKLWGVGDWRLSIDQLKQTGVTKLVVLTIQHHCNEHRQHWIIIIIIIIITRLRLPLTKSVIFHGRILPFPGHSAAHKQAMTHLPLCPRLVSFLLWQSRNPVVLRYIPTENATHLKRDHHGFVNSVVVTTFISATPSMPAFDSILLHHVTLAEVRREQKNDPSGLQWPLRA